MASALTGASHALRPRPGRPLTRSRGARRRGQALDAELAARASAPLDSLLGLLTAGLVAYKEDAELLSSTMIAVRQLLGPLRWLKTLRRPRRRTAPVCVRPPRETRPSRVPPPGCWLENDDTVEFVGLDELRFEQVRASGVLAAVAEMVAAHPPSLQDEGSLELHEHAIATWSAAALTTSPPWPWPEPWSRP